MTLVMHCTPQAKAKKCLHAYSTLEKAEQRSITGMQLVLGRTDESTVCELGTKAY
jgi:hypothetical protein